MFLVEGDLEKEFLTEICGGKSTILKIQNGSSVSPHAIAKQVSALVNAISIEPSYVAVIVDRESRVETSVDLEQEIFKCLTQLSLKPAFSVHVPDKMIENWIIADTGLMTKEQLTIKIPTEGTHGKGELSRVFKAKKLNYKERIDGVKLLKAASASVIKTNSISFERLLNTLGAVMGSCHWLRK